MIDLVTAWRHLCYDLFWFECISADRTDHLIICWKLSGSEIGGYQVPWGGLTKSTKQRTEIEEFGGETTVRNANAFKERISFLSKSSWTFHRAMYIPHLLMLFFSSSNIIPKDRFCWFKANLALGRILVQFTSTSRLGEQSTACFHKRFVTGLIPSSSFLSHITVISVTRVRLVFGRWVPSWVRFLDGRLSEVAKWGI